ncbi:uncharacterized protein LOC132197802 [Neocloeon triangulifer]|uniref:uncharacterized protein LOC132197802 n=1 Tax=Neocloeon triangulifer TaxID=2078957 RepID=UPI00286EC220|nr:uncharacterized protein LOC132197802 [Neocloeon triangulifer]
MEAEVIYDDVMPGPSNAEDRDEGKVTIRLPTRVKKKRERKQQGCSTAALTVAFALSIVFAIFSTSLLNHFLLSTKMCNGQEKISAFIAEAMQMQFFNLSGQNEALYNEMQDKINSANKRLEQNQALDNEMQDKINSANKRLEQLEFVARVLVHNHHLNISEFLTPINCTLARSHSANLARLSNGKKYYFSNPYTCNWTEANERCKRMGLHLATLKDEADLNATWTEAKKRETEAKKWAFGDWNLSAKNYGTGEKSDYRWHDGSELPQNSTLWRDDANKIKSCAYFYTGNTVKLSGGTCSLKKYFICELPSICY